MTAIWILMLFSSLSGIHTNGILGKESSVAIPVFQGYYKSQDECKSALKEISKKIIDSPDVTGICIEGYKKQ